MARFFSTLARSGAATALTVVAAVIDSDRLIDFALNDAMPQFD